MASYLTSTNKKKKTSGSYLSTRKSSSDLTSTEGLFNVAQNAGGNVAKKANQIVGDKKSLFSKITSGVGKGLGKVLDVVQRFNYAGASAVKNTIDNDPNTTFGQGLVSGITGKTKFTYSDVFDEAGWKPDKWTGKAARGITGFAFDVLLDPTTYLTFGASAGVKVGVKVGDKVVTRTLSKEGSKLLAKGVAQKAGEEFGVDFVKRAIGNLASKSPELYSKFIDQGGIKFFNKTLISGGRIAGVTSKIPGMSKLDKATEPFRNTVYSLFHRDASAKYGKLPNEYIQLQQKFRDIGKVRGEDAINNVVNIAKANKLTAQEAEIITNAIEAKLPIADERLENARKLLEQSLGRNLKEELRAGISTGDLPNYVPHLLVNESTRNIPFKPQGVRVSAPFSAGRKIEGTIDEINKTFGKEFFDPNIVNTAGIRAVASARAVTSKEFLTDVAQKFGTLAEKAPLGYVEAGAKELKGLKFHPAIAESIDKFGSAFVGDEATNQLLKAFDKAQNLWKASVTSIFPAFHARNGLSNVFLNFLDIGAQSINPSKHIMSSVLLKKNSDVSKLEKLIRSGGEGAKSAKATLEAILKKPVLTDDFGKTWTFGEIRKEIRERRVAFGDEFTGFLDIREGIKDKLGTASKGKKVIQAINPLSQNNIAFKAGRKVGNAIEQQARVLNFVSNLERTGDVVTAAERTKQFLFDYTNLSEFEKNVMRRLIPFYTFTRKNLELQVSQALKQPGKLATQAKVFTNVSKTLSGGSLTEEETKLLPEFLQEGLGILYDRNGSKITMINSLGTPVEQIFANLKPNSILGSMSPIIAVPLQIAIGKNFFFDKDLKDVDNAIAYKDAPKFIKDYIGFTVRKNKDGSERYIALDPTRMFILNNIPPSSRVVSTIGQLNANNVSGKLKILRLLSGIKPYGEDLDLQQQIQEKQKMRDLQDLLDQSGVAPIFKRSFIPK